MIHYGAEDDAAGIQRALQHIREGEKLSRELGGTDVDVKEYFFSLSASELGPILDEYERRHGQLARDYAIETIPAWRSGRRKMSGQTASRLFDLLPRFMPLERKYGLVESLWKRIGPQSRYTISVGRDADLKDASDLITRHLRATVNEHAIPDSLRRRFDWLADGDSRVVEQLSNHFLKHDRELAAYAANETVALLLLPDVRNGGELASFKRDIQVGGHVLHVVFDPQAKGLSIAKGLPPYRAPHDVESAIGRLILVGFIILVIWLVARVL